MDEGPDKHGSELLSALDAKQQELADILEEFVLIENESPDIEEDSDIEIISEEANNVNMLPPCGVTDHEPNSELSNEEETKRTAQTSNSVNGDSESKVLQSDEENIQDVELADAERGIVLNTIQKDTDINSKSFQNGTHSFRQLRTNEIGENIEEKCKENSLEDQASESEILARKMVDIQTEKVSISENRTLRDTSAENDKISSEYQSDSQENLMESRKEKNVEENTTGKCIKKSVGSQTSKSLSFPLVSETQTEESSTTESRILPVLESKSDQGAISEFQNDEKRCNEKSLPMEEIVGKSNTVSLGNQTSKSPSVTVVSSGTQTEESFITDSSILPDTVNEYHQETSTEFQNGTKRKYIGKINEKVIEESTLDGSTAKNVLKGTSQSDTLTFETKHVEDKELPSKKRKMLLEKYDSDEGSSLEFQKKKSDIAGRTNRVREKQNYSEVEMRIQESKTLKGYKTSVTQTEVSCTFQGTSCSGSEIYSTTAQHFASLPYGYSSKIEENTKTDGKKESPEKIENQLSESHMLILQAKATQTGEWAPFIAPPYRLQSETEQSSILNSAFTSSNIGKKNLSGTKPKLTEAEREEILQTLQIRTFYNTPVSPEDTSDILQGRKSDTNKCVSDTHFNRDSYTTHGGSGALIKSARASSHDFRGNRNEPIKHSQLRTLEDSLEAFGLLPRLLELEDSLENVRRRRRTPDEHEADCKRFDKQLQNLSRHYHPDSVIKRGGTEEELARAKEQQTALNASRTVLNTINKIFLEDIDIKHKYAFFLKMDIGVLGNSDEVENHVYEILFKISLVSDIKQEHIVVEIRKFLEAAQLCLRSFFQNDASNFVKHRGLAFYHLKRCVTGYEKLHLELQEVEAECEDEKLRNIHHIINRMKRECQKQLKHLQKLFELSKLPFGELGIQINKYPQAIDEYFVLPFYYYVNVILVCSVFFRKFQDKGVFRSLLNCELPSFMKKNQSSSQNDGYETTGSRAQTFQYSFPKAQNLSDRKSITEDDCISLLYRLASCYAGSKQYKNSIKDLFEWDHMDTDGIRKKFRETLMWVSEDLKSRFKMEDYVENGTRKQIVKELKLCREMMTEFEEETRSVASCVKEISKNNDYMKTRLDKLLSDQDVVSSELTEFLADAKVFKEQIENFSRKRTGASNRDSSGFSTSS